MGPHPAVAQVRLAVRRCLTRAGLEPGDLVLAACSGGADSLALVAAVAFEAPRLGLTAGGVTVDHGLQAGSAGQAAEVAKVLTAIGLDPVLSLSAAVAARPGAAGCHGPTGTAAAGPAGAAARGSADPGAASPADPGDYPGPEAAAREARYRALDQAAAAAGAAAIMLGHTRDDQAETVLLGLARGSGARSLAGMPERNGRYLRPLLGISRAQTRAACAAQNLEPWDDPQNADPGYARARVRHRLLPALERELGPGVTEALARSADLLRVDADFLDSLAQTASERIAGGGGGGASPPGGIAGRGGGASPRGGIAGRGGGASLPGGIAGRGGASPWGGIAGGGGGASLPGGIAGGGGGASPRGSAAAAGGGSSSRGSTAAAGPGLAIEELAALPAAIRSRVLRNAAIAAGCPAGALTAGHVAALDALVTGWRGQRGTDLPGGIRGRRRYGKLTFSARHGGDDTPSTPRQASNREGAGGRE
jgi:tRNA(Ile)-lysidine synthase